MVDSDEVLHYFCKETFILLQNCEFWSPGGGMSPLCDILVTQEVESGENDVHQPLSRIYPTIESRDNAGIQQINTIQFQELILLRLQKMMSIFGQIMFMTCQI